MTVVTSTPCDTRSKIPSCGAASGAGAAATSRVAARLILRRCNLLVFTLFWLVTRICAIFLPWVAVYRLIPLRAMSRTWGWINSVDLPVSLRSTVISWYIKAFGVNLDDCLEQDLTKYKNLGEFFSRRLKADARSVDPTADVVCPSDGKILSYGIIEGDQIEQVKGVTYGLDAFVGPPTWMKRAYWDGDDSDVDDDDVADVTDVSGDISGAGDISGGGDISASDLIMNKSDGHRLYYCIIYLAPGDYHGFHSPANWNVHYRRHFPGSLLSVSPGIAQWIRGLFNYNERVMCTGQWQYGFYSLTAVGATNVGSITILFDKYLKTNRPYLTRRRTATYFDRDYLDPSYLSSIRMDKGDLFGMFHLGSSIVLIFEAPQNFAFTKPVGAQIRVGEALGRVDPAPAPTTS